MATSIETRTRFPELVIQEEKRVRFVVVNGLVIVDKPNSVPIDDAEWWVGALNFACLLWCFMFILQWNSSSSLYFLFHENWVDFACKKLLIIFSLLISRSFSLSVCFALPCDELNDYIYRKFWRIWNWLKSTDLNYFKIHELELVWNPSTTIS